MAQRVGPGVWMIGRYSPFEVGAWVLEHGGEAALLEAPPYQAGRPRPWDDCLAFVNGKNLEVKWILFTHAHMDHTFGLQFYRRAFPRARVLAHVSFLSWFRRNAFDEIFYADERCLDLGGEPLLLLHAPKHSPQDCLVFFRGCMCSGDWSLGEAPDCNRSVPPEKKIDSLRRLDSFLRKHAYHVHTVFSAHGNEFRHNVDLSMLVDGMIRYWTRRSREKGNGRKGRRRR